MKAVLRTKLVRKKILKVFLIVLFVRTSLYIPVPYLPLDCISQVETLGPNVSFFRILTGGSSYLALGSLGILPYINSSILMQLLTSISPRLDSLRKDGGELGDYQIVRETRLLTFGWALLLSFFVAYKVVKPLIFDCSDLQIALIVWTLTLGSMISMWAAEAITSEEIGNGSSILIFTNIVANIPRNLKGLILFYTSSYHVVDNLRLVIGILVYCFFLIMIIIFQDAYKRIDIVSIREIGSDTSDSRLSIGKKLSYIPLKLNVGGITPLIFSSALVSLLLYPTQILLASDLISKEIPFFKFIILPFLGILYCYFILFFNAVYTLLLLQPSRLAWNLLIGGYLIPEIGMGVEPTSLYLEKILNRLSLISGIFLIFLVFCSFMLGSFLKIRFIRNITSLLILVGVVTDISSRIKGYFIDNEYTELLQ
jgi:preprotein translocase subunit SecY